MSSELLTVSQAAKRINTSDRFIRRLISERRITFHKVGKHVRLSISDIDAFIAQGKVSAARND